MAALQEEAATDRATAQARRQTQEATDAAHRAHMAALNSVSARQPVLWESPAETRARLHADAERAGWSVAADTCSPPKVFRLVGKSADEVQALLGQQVSQQVTSVYG